MRPQPLDEDVPDRRGGRQDASSVREAVLELYADTWPGAPRDTLEAALRDFERLFTGEAPGYLGVDTGRRSELIAAQMSVEQICEYIGADSLAYLSEDGLTRALDIPRSKFCFACFNGDYPVSVQMEFDKLTFEAREPVKA